MLPSTLIMALDTTPGATLLQQQAYREFGLAGRLRIALELSDLTHAFAVAGIRLRHPEFSEEEARRELATVLYRAAVDRGEK
jgi:hypothetical protein